MTQLYFASRRLTNVSYTFNSLIGYLITNKSAIHNAELLTTKSIDLVTNANAFPR